LELAQVIKAKAGGFDVPVDSSTELVTQLTGLVSGEIYPLTLGDNPGNPRIVYQLVGSQASEINGYRITQTDTYVLFIRHSSYDGLISLVSSAITALNGASFSIDVVDILFDYDDVQESFRANIEINVAYLSAPVQTLPAAFVYPLSRDAEDSQYDNVIKQFVSNNYAIAVVTDAGNMSTLLDAVMVSLLGWQQDSAFNEMQYVTGQNLEGVAGLEIWRETYQDSNYITQA